MTFTADEHFQRELPITEPEMKAIDKVENLCIAGDTRGERFNQGSTNDQSHPVLLHGNKQNRFDKQIISHQSNSVAPSLFTLNGQERVDAIHRLVQEGQQACLQAQKSLLQVIDDPSAAMRAAAIEALGILGEHAPVAVLIQALKDDEFWDVRAAAAQALGMLGTKVPIEELVVALSYEEDESVREAIIRALGKQGKQALADILIATLRDKEENWLVRSSAAWGLGELGEHAPLDPLIRVLHHDPNKLVRAAAARALGCTGNKHAEIALFEVLGDKERGVQEAAAWALQQLDEETRGLSYRERSYDTFKLGSDEERFFQEQHRYISSSDIPDIQRQRTQLLSALREFVKDKKGYVHQSQHIETEQGQTLFLRCYYRQTEHSLPNVVRDSLHDAAIIQPLEAALDEQDDVVRSIIAQSVESWDQRHWQEMFVVSFALSHPDRWDRQEQMPLRVVVAGVGYPQVRRTDSSILEQISTTWSQELKEPLVFQHPQELLDLKIWHQSIGEAQVLQSA